MYKHVDWPWLGWTRHYLYSVNHPSDDM